jgi:LPS-assembly protein
MPHRYAMLVVALAVAAPVIAQNRRAPVKPPAAERPAPVTAPVAEEKGPMTIDAERIDGIGELEATARGSAEINQDELTIFGDYLKYNQEFGRIDADGGVRLQMGVDRFFGPRLRYSTVDDTGVFEQPGFLLQRDLPARGNASSVEFMGKQKYRLKDVSFTTCQPGNDDWFLEAAEMDLDYDAEVGHAKSPKLRFFDTTILKAPFASFPLENRRKSGLLTPYYAHSSTRGLETSIPIYWNIAPERDYTLTPVYMTKRGLLLKNELRYLDRPYAGELRLEYLPNDATTGVERHGISWQHSQSLAPGLRAQVDYNQVSDARYFVDLSSQVRQASIGNLTQDANATYSSSIAGIGYGLTTRVQRFQTLQDPLAPIVPPYARIPQINFSTGKNDVGGLVDTSLNMEYVRFLHPTLVQGSRISANPAFASPVLAPGWFITPKAGLRYMGYNIENTPAGTAGSPGVAIPWFSADTGLIFERDARWFGENLTQTFEPRLFYVYVPYRNQDQIPIFDTGLAEFNFPQLFSENRFAGGDRFGDANQLTTTFTTRFLQNNGQEALRATLGQRYYFTNERVGLTPTDTLRTYHTSDLLASVGGRLFKYWTFDTTTQYNQRESKAQRYTVSTRYSPELAKVVSASYRFNQDPANPLKQIDVSGQLPVAAGWYAVGRYNYSLLDKRLVDGLAGVEYNAGCWVFRAVFQRMQAAAQIASTAIFVQIEFTGVGQLGTDEVVTQLKRNVPGYSSTNPRDPTLAPSGVRQRLPFEQVY